MLEILLFLFQNYLEKNSNSEELSVLTELTAQLEDAGFDLNEINQAFDWLKQINAAPLSRQIASATAIRSYNYFEREKLSVEAIGFLYFLEHSNVIDPFIREVVIERAMALISGVVTVEQLQWIVLMVLFNQPKQKAALTWMETHMLEINNTTKH